MESFSPDYGLRLFLALGTLLLATRMAGEAARRLGQPAVLGEIVAGIVLGPTVLGRIAPRAVEYLFPEQGPGAFAFQALMALSVTLFMLAAGIEVDLSSVMRRGRTMLAVAVGGVAAPFVLGYVAVLAAPEWFGAGESGHPRVFPLFFSTALSISALPVIVKTLMDLRLYRTDLGVTVVGAAVLNDLVGWLCFAGILASVAEGPSAPDLGATISLTLIFSAGMLTVGRWLVHRSLPFVLAHTSWPGGVLAFSLSLGLFCAAFTSFAGVHSLFGAFLAGVALGDSAHLREQTRGTINDFVSYFFAPLFFGSIGLTVDFVENFDPLLCGAVFLVACLGKVLGCTAGALWTGTPRRESWAIGFAMNARGSMEIILGLVALQSGLIGERLFVALVVMALGTSLMSGPLLQRLTLRSRGPGLVKYLVTSTFLPALRARDRRAAISELAATLAPAVRLHPSRIVELAWEREQRGPTGVGDGIAVPHARVPDLEAPLIALGFSHAGIDFDAIDGQPARIVALVLTPADAAETQLEILSAIGSTFADPVTRERALSARSLQELRSVLQTHG